MKEENKKRINKLMVPLTLKSVSLFSAFTMITTGMSGCKKVDKNDTSSLNNDITTADTSEIENNQTDTTSEIDSNKVNTTSEIEISSSKEDTSKTESNVSSSANSSKKPSTSNSQITSNTSSVSQPSNSQTTSPSTPSSSSEENVRIFEPLTEQNINNIDVFKIAANQIASETRGNFGGIWTYYYNNETYRIPGVPKEEFRYVLAGLNYEYLNDDTLIELFGNYSLDDLKRFNSIIELLVVSINDSNKKNKWDDIIVNKQTLNDLNQMEIAYLNYKNDVDQNQLKLLLDGGMKNTNPIVRRYFKYMCEYCFENDHSENNKYNSLSADLHFDTKKEINNFCEEIYNRINVKTKVLN